MENENKMNVKEYLPYALSSYQQEYQRHQNLDSKAFNFLGFAGVMVSIFSFLLGAKLPHDQFLGINIFGICLLLASMIIIVYIVFPKKSIPRIVSKKYYDKLNNNQTVADLTKSYVQLTTRFEWRNNKKTEKLKCAIIVMLIGLGMSFLGTMLSII